MAVSAKLSLQQKQQYFQKRQHASYVASSTNLPHQRQQPVQQQMSQPVSSIITIDGLLVRILNNITNLLGLATTSQEPSLVCSLRNLIEVVQPVKALDSRGITADDRNACMRIIDFVLRSLFNHYRPLRWTEHIVGLQVLEQFKEAHIIVLRRLMCYEQKAWVTEQVTRSWILFPDIDTELPSIQPFVSSKAEQFLAEAKVVTQLPTGGDCNALTEPYGLHCKWNWEAFAELLKIHTFYLTHIDFHLASKLSSGHPIATTFVLNLLDYFVLPAVVASPSFSIPVYSSPSGKSRQLTINSTQTIPSRLGSLFIVTSKRDFTVLNEYDLWYTIRALRKMGLAIPIAPTDFNLRLRISCARVEALMNWGFFETKILNQLDRQDSMQCAGFFVGFSRARETDDTLYFKTKMVNFFCQWVDFYYSTLKISKAELSDEQAVNNFADKDFLFCSDKATRFFRQATIYVTDKTIFRLKSTVKLSVTDDDSFYSELDAYARLISYAVNWEGDSREIVIEVNDAKIDLLDRVLGIIGGTLMQSHETRPEHFNPIPFKRLLIMLFTYLCNSTPTPFTSSSDRNLTEVNPEGLTLQEYIPISFGKLLHMLRPVRVAKFTLAFLEIISHRCFVTYTLGALASKPSQLLAAYRAVYAQLFADILSYIAFYIQNGIKSNQVSSLYTALLGLSGLLVREFPEFMSEYSSFFCNIVPSSSIQLRNLFLFGEPKGGLSSVDPINAPIIDQLSQLEDPIGYSMEAGNRLPPVLRSKIDFYFTSRTFTRLLLELGSMLRRVDSIYELLANPPQLLMFALNAVYWERDRMPAAVQKHSAIAAAAQQAHMVIFWSALGSQMISTFGFASCMHYNLELMADLILYLCVTAVRSLRDSGMPLTVASVASTPQMDIIRQILVKNLDDEGCYFLLTCMANQLRYINSHTYFFYYSLLYLFVELPLPKLKEQISRVLMERLVMKAPHPWGLLLITSELLRNPFYHYWDYEFTHCDKDIEKMLNTFAIPFNKPKEFKASSPRSCISNYKLPQNISYSITDSDNASNNISTTTTNITADETQSSKQTPSVPTPRQKGMVSPDPSPQSDAEYMARIPTDLLNQLGLGPTS